MPSVSLDHSPGSAHDDGVAKMGVPHVELAEAVVVEFPLRGEGWVAITSPADRIPSHGTDLLGMRFAYDFVKVDERRRRHVHPASRARALFLGVRTEECYAWGETVHAPMPGRVVEAVDGMPERSRVHPVREALLRVKNAVTFRPGRLAAIQGNHVIVQNGRVTAAFVHLAPGSVTVGVGDMVGTGDVLGRVGHTGNSTSPHLHFQLSDSPDAFAASGIPCAFGSYEVLIDGDWRSVTNGIPAGADRIRSIRPR